MAEKDAWLENMKIKFSRWREEARMLVEGPPEVDTEEALKEKARVARAKRRKTAKVQKECSKVLKPDAEMEKMSSGDTENESDQGPNAMLNLMAARRQLLVKRIGVAFRYNTSLADKPTRQTPDQLRNQYMSDALALFLDDDFVNAPPESSPLPLPPPSVPLRALNATPAYALSSTHRFLEV